SFPGADVPEAQPVVGLPGEEELAVAGELRELEPPACGCDVDPLLYFARAGLPAFDDPAELVVPPALPVRLPRGDAERLAVGGEQDGLRRRVRLEPVRRLAGVLLPQPQAAFFPRGARDGPIRGHGDAHEPCPAPPPAERAESGRGAGGQRVAIRVGA